MDLSLELHGPELHAEPADEAEVEQLDVAAGISRPFFSLELKPGAS